MDTPTPASLESAIAAHRDGRDADAIAILRPLTTSQNASYLLGVLLFSAHDHPGAIEALERCVSLDDAHADGWSLLGRIYYKDHHIEKSIPAFKKAFCYSHKPELLESLTLASSKLAQQYEMAHETLKAAHLMQELVDLGSRDPNVFRRLAQYYQLLGQTARARSVYDQLQSFHPSIDNLLGKWMCIDIVKHNPVDIDAHIDATLAALDDFLHQPKESNTGLPSKFILSGLYYFSYHYRNIAPLKKKIADVLLHHYQSLQFTAEHCISVPQKSTRKIRIGFVSNLFRKHTIGRLNIGLIEHLNKHEFELYIFSSSHHNDSMAQRFHRAADHVVSIPNDLFKARRIIASHALDILCFSDIGMDPLLYFLSFSRLAPKQCVFWGHPETTGISTLDYFISAQNIEPEDAQSHYNETLVKLAHLPMYYEMPVLPHPIPSRSELGIPQDQHLYLCPQTLYKLHPDFDGILADILTGDHQGIIGLIEGMQPSIKAQFQARFSEKFPEIASRIHWISYIPNSAFLALLIHADVMLDPLYFGGGNSTFEALALGCPIVTWPGKHMRARVTSGCYAQMGIEGLTVGSRDEYVKKAIEISSNSDIREHYKKAILEKNSAVIESMEAVHELETFFRDISKSSFDSNQEAAS